jgi:hypothetical protein
LAADLLGRVPRVSLLGGPLDGADRLDGFRDRFLWFNHRGASRRPGRGRALYRRYGPQPEFHFVGNLMALCECGVYRYRLRPCAFCGSSKTRAGG